MERVGGLGVGDTEDNGYGLKGGVGLEGKTLGNHLPHVRWSTLVSSLRASCALAKAKVSMSEEGRESKSSRRMSERKPVIKNEIKRGSEIPVTLFISSSNSDWNSATVVRWVSLDRLPSWSSNKDAPKRNRRFWRKLVQVVRR